MKNFYSFLGILTLFITAPVFAQDCNDLEILTTSDGSVCGGGSVTLEATASGTGDGVYWYDAPTGGTYLGQGNSFQTSSISTTTSYWVTEVFDSGTGFSSGHGLPAPISGQTFGSAANYGLLFDVHQSFTLHSVDVYTGSATGDDIEIKIFDESLNELYVVNETVPPGNGTTPYEVVINYTFTPGNDYRISRTSTGGSYKYENSSAATIGYPLQVSTVATIKRGAYGTAIPPGGGDHLYYIFYNWTVGTIDVICESDREEVIATVNNDADEEVLTLPYTHTAATDDYANNYSGSPGDDCGSTDAYLDGYDVVYHYQADDDYILTIELSGLSDAYSGVFIYESCADIGNECAAEGSVNETSGDHGFQVAVTDLQDYYIVVSSAGPTESMGYTLTINGTTCANYPAPSGSSAQNFIDGQTLADLDVTGPNLTWYSDASATIQLPDDTTLINGTTYYVSQTFQGCEGGILAVTVTELACSVLEILTSDDGSVCGEGSVTLMAQGAAPVVNSEIYWYDAAVGGNLVGAGNVFETPVLEQTTSYWVTEVALSEGLATGQAQVTPVGLINTTTSNAGLLFNVTQPFSLVDVEVLSTASGGTIQVDIRDIDDGNNVVFTTTATIPGGGSTTSPIPVTIPINYYLTPGNYRILRVTSGATVGLGYQSAANSSFPYTLGNTNLGEITTGSTLSGTSTLYYYFYNWTVSEAVVLCESPREEVIATVNEVADEMVSEPMPYVHTANTSSYGNNYSGNPGSDCDASGDYLNGNDVVYQFSPSTGAVYSVMLSGLSSNNAAVFVYESCYDIGSGCYAGAVGDGTTSDFGIEEVAMYDGNDYFIVVSTSNSPSTAYTLTIDIATIDCMDYTAAPDGNEDQFFEDGDTLADLDVNGGNLTWYSDSAGTTSIPDTTVIVDGTTYYVSQTLNGCESDLLAVTVTEIDCTSLEILSTTGGTIVCKGSTVLEAVGNGGLGTEIYWYDAATDGELLGTGPTYTTPELTATTSYWAVEVFIEDSSGASGSVGPVDNTMGAGGGTSAAITTYYMEFDVLVQTELVSVDIFPTATVGSTSSIEIRDSSGNTIINVPYTTTVTGGLTAQTIPLNVTLSPGTGYRMGQVGPIALYRNTAGAVYPYTSSGINIISNNFGPTYYYYFYNWQFGGGTVLCESPREEVIATVTQDGDEVVAALPYSHTASTSTYGNTFSGAPGSDCGTTENYLNGNDVVYQYIATDDDLLTIELADISGFYGGVFIYESCGDIGDACIEGVVAGPSDADISIEEFEVLQGQTYYIVVSSWLTSSIDYTLNIYGFDCAGFEAPEGEEDQDFVAGSGDTLANLDVSGTMNGVTFTWYEDAALTIVLPDTTLLVDGETYYVTQTFDTCEGAALAITVTEIDCSDLEIVSTTGGSVVCLGSMTLEAVGSGSGSEIYWYDAPTGGNLVGIGSTFETPELTTTTSYWAAEVHLEQGSGNNPMPSPCTPVHGASGCGSGDNINDFTLSEAGGGVLISHLGTGCSTNAYGDFTADPNLTAILIANSDYDVALTHNFQTSQWVKIWIDFDFDGVFDEATELVFQSSSGSSGGVTNGSFSIPSSVIGSTTIMRVSVRYAGLPDNACTIGGSFGETHDYKVTVVGSSALCESPREEAIATVNQTGDKVVTGPLPYSDTDTTFNFGNNFSGAPGCGISGNYLDGNDVVYQYTPASDDIVIIELTGVTNANTGVFVYESCGDVGGNCLGGTISENGVYMIEDFYVTGGQDYFIVIGSESGSSGYTLNIYGFDCVTLGAPDGDANQIYVDPATLADLTVDTHVHSTGLNWYADAAGTQPIPDTTPLVDGETYWVSQTVLGCEGALLEITVNELDCSVLDLLSVEGSVLCAPGGEMTLTAQGSGNGNEIYWYDAQTGGNIVGVGEELTVNVSSTTSYWAAEIFLDGGVGASGSVGPVNPSAVGTAGGGLASTYQVTFDVLIPTTLLSVDIYPTAAVGSNGTIEIRESTGGLVTSVPYTTTVTGGSTPQTVLFNVPLTPGSYYMVQATPTIALYRNTSGGTYPYTSPAIHITGNTFDPAYYYHFYNWQYGGGTVLCESAPMEVIAEVNTTIPAPPIGDLAQDFCGNDNMLSQVDVVGDNIQWYNGNGNPVSPFTVLEDGDVYYATQTVNACESGTLEVTIGITDKSDKPVGDINQSFVVGQTITSLDVTGTNLLWYSDASGNNAIPESTPLVDQTTYYVSQTTGDLCESDLLGITVHRVLTVEELLFGELVYYPNPVDNVLTITNSVPMDTVELYSLLGQKVLSKNVGFDTATLDVSALASGTYLLKVTIDEKVGVYRVIKE